MSATDFVAILALVVSLGSAYISFRAHRHSVDVHELETSLAFERDKSELLSYIEQSRRHFSDAISEIERVKFVLGHEPSQVQIALSSYENLFTEFLPKLVGAERQANTLWSEIYDWRDKSGRGAFAHHSPRHRALVADDKFVYDMAMICVTELRHQLARAQAANANGLLG